MNHKTTRLLSVLIALFMVVLSIPVTALTNVEEIQTVNKEPLQEYDIIPNDSYVAESESVEQQLTSSSTINGVYAIRKANTNVYVQNNTLSSLSWVYQETNSTPPISSTDREFLFKIAYRSETNDYVIRSMLNNEIIIYPSVLNNAPVSGKVKVSGQPATDSNLSIKYTWKMTTTTDGYKYIWYNDGSTTYYIKSTSDTGGGPILKFTTNPNDTGTKWQFYQYTGAAINSTTSISYTNELMRGETFDFDVCMYSSTVGINGPIVYSVSEPDYSETDKATINSSSGLLTALKGGIIRVQWTYSGAPWIWSRLVTINFEDDIVHFFKNASSSLLFQPANADVGSYIVANTYSYSRTSMMWKFEYENGFYKIKNDVTGYYLRAPASNSEGAKISQSTYSSVYGLWKIEKTSDGHYRIQSKNQYERGASNPLYLKIESGNLVQGSYSNSCNWDIEALTLKINVIYDQGFVDRYGTSYMNVLKSIYGDNSAGLSFASVFKERFGIRLDVDYSDSVYESYPYTSNCNHKNQIDVYCYDCKSAASDSTVEECTNGLHHKAETKFLGNISNGQSLENAEQTNILYTGHRGCYTDGTTHSTQSAYGWSYLNGNRIVIMSALFNAYITHILIVETLIVF